MELIEQFEDPDREQHLVIMTLCYGVDVCEWFLHVLDTEGKVPPRDRVIKYFKQMCEGVKHCHDCGVLHRDLKLENFLFENVSETTLKLCDFG